LLKNNFIIPVPAQMRSANEDWYRGTADAIYQNLNLIQQADPHVVAIFGADHIYRMNIRQMIEYHIEKQAGVTIAAIPVEKELASEFGVIETTSDARIRGFHEKKVDAPTMPDDPARVFASMGNYIFSTDVLLRELLADGQKINSSHDFGKDILPSLIGRADMYAYDFQTNVIPGDPIGSPQYWRDVGTIDAYYEASMDLRAVSPELNLYNRQWPLRTAGYFDAPAKFVFDEDGRRGIAVDSIIAGSSIVSGGSVKGSVLGRGVRIHTGASVEDSIIFDNCDIGRRSKVKRAILDKNVKLPPDTTIGYDLEADKKKYHVTDTGIVIVEGHQSKVDISSLQV
jgi:glucose-1-phosphate adenylyltransferase